MSESAVERRTTPTPSTGARVALTIAALFLIAAAYHLLVPLSVVSHNGGKFDCRSAIQGPRTELAKNTCGDIYKASIVKASGLAAGGVVTALGGILAFGMIRREDERPRRDEDQPDF